MSQHRTMRISEVARLTGLGIGMIRYYERVGLVSPTERSGRGYRLFAEIHVQELRFVIEMKRLGFKANETRLLKASEQHPEPQTLEIKRELLKRRLAAVEEEIAELQSVRQELLKRLE